MDWPCAEADFDDITFKSFRSERSLCTISIKIIRKLWSDEELKCWDIKSSEDLERWINENQILMRDECESGTFALLFSRCGREEYSHPSYIPVTEVYTARMSAAFPDDIAMSSTYLTNKRLNLSVFYGCNEDQLSGIEKRLRMAGDAIYHPMLPAGILVELDRIRLVEQVRSAFTTFIQRTEDLCFTSCDPEKIMDKDGESIGQLSYLYNDARELAKGIRKVKRQISDMCSHIRELHRQKRGLRKRLRCKRRTSTNFDAYLIAASVGVQINERLQEIAAEYDESLDECDMVTDGLAFSTQLAADRANIQIAVDTRQENARMRLISLVTMVYLPVTSVATIFSMGVFNWGAAAKQSVFTFYFWVYIAVAGGLTVLTVGSWWALTRTTSRISDSTADTTPTIPSPTHGPEGIV
ncbi:hypothetical protein F5Y13DRAFT_202170 [Hypoxylon sp. FL1857]|nr:hypothetical protein F5Y13DRAFT_202170 [Hypoxylon sp. FL1857]